MFTGLVRGLASLNSTTKFEKCRVQATYYGDSYAPKEDHLQFIIKTLSGEDSETKAISGFNMIMGKLKASESRKYWNYVVKNLVILDRLIEERHFIKDIAELDMPEVEQYDAREKKYKDKRIEELIANYYGFIRAKAEIYWKKDSSLNISKDKRRNYFKSLESDDILAENRVLNALSISAFDIFHTGDHGHLKYKLNQYVFLLVLSSILNIFATQYVAFIAIIERFFDMDLAMAIQSHLAFKDFLQRTEDLITFAGNHQFIPGFQISLHELRNPAADTKLLGSMQEYIRLLEIEANGYNVHIDRKSFAYNRNELQPKRSEIDIARLSVHFQVAGDDDDGVSPITFEKGVGTPLPDKSPDKKDDESAFRLFRHKTLSLTFSDSLKHGFRGRVSIEPVVNDNLLDEYKVDEDDTIQETEEGQIEENDIEGQKKVPGRNLTVVFKKLLFFEDEDPLFSAQNNHFSYEVNTSNPMDKSLSKSLSGRWTKPYHEMKTLGNVFTEGETVVKVIEPVQEEKESDVVLPDFNEDIFDKFTNLYSKDFVLKK